MDPSSPSTPSRRPRWTLLAPWLVLILGALGTIIAARWADRMVERDAHAIFARNSNHLAEALRGRLAINQTILRAAAGLFNASDDVARAEWQRFVQELRLADHRSTLNTVAYAPYVAAADLPAQLERMRTEDGAPADIGPAPGGRTHFAPIRFIEPHGPEQAAFIGRDLLDEPIVREAAQRAATLRHVVATPHLPLLATETGSVHTAGFLLIYPVVPSPPTSPPAEPPPPAGFVVAPVRMAHLVSGVLPLRAEGIELIVHDGQSTAADTIMFASAPRAENTDHTHDLVHTIEFGGHHWTLVFFRSAAFAAHINRVGPRTAIAAGLVLTAALFFLMRASLAGENRALDLAARKTHELAETAGRLQVILDHEPECVKTVDADGRILEINRAGLAMTELENTAAATGRSFFEFVHDDDEAAVRTLHHRVMRGETGTLQFRLIGQQGTTRWLDTHEVPLLGPDGTILCALGVARDVTSQRQAEEQLRRSEANLRRAQRIGHIGSWEYDCASQRFTCSPETLRLLALDPTAGAPTTSRLIELIHPDDRDRVRAQSANALAGGRPDLQELRILHPDGAVRWLVMHMDFARGSTGQVERIIGVVQDITERKRAEEETASLQSRLQQAQKMEAIGTLAGGIAHDFNNILAAILFNASLLRDDLAPNPELAENVSQIIASSQRARDLVKQILTFSRRDETSRQRLPLQEVVDDALKMLRSTLPATIEIRAPIKSPEAIVLGDPTQLHQVLINLATNAAHAIGPRPGVFEVAVDHTTVDARYAAANPGLAEGRYVRISVSDTGEGMDPKTLERIFEPFFTTKPPGQGTGLGLSVVHGIVKDHRGIVTASSDPGHGSRFQILLPSLDEKPAAPEPPRRIEPAGHGEHILLVDDEQMITTALKRILGRMGYRVTEMNSSLDALAAFEAAPHDFALLITDQTMPEMLGIDLVRKVLATRPRLPVIMATGYGARVDVETARRMGVSEVLLKPISIDTLVAAVQRALTAHAPPSPPQRP